jgi:hypothetical protein
VDSVTTAPVSGQACGTVRPIIVGKPTYDRARRLIGLPIALENTGQRALRVPARLYGWEDSVVITAPRGLGGNEYAGHVDLAAADSSIPTTSSRFAGAVLWRFDTLLATSGESQVLAAGARSRGRQVELTALPGVLQFEAKFWADARVVGSIVPAIAPDGVTDEAWAALTSPANVVVERPGGPRRVRNAVWVVFQPSAQQSDRQAAIDLVAGEVVGGSMGLGRQYGGMYLVRIPDATAAASDSVYGPVLRARAQLLALPTVKYVWLVVLDPPGPTLRRPDDSGVRNVELLVQEPVALRYESPERACNGENPHGASLAVTTPPAGVEIIGH